MDFATSGAPGGGSSPGGRGAGPTRTPDREGGSPLTRWAHPRAGDHGVREARALLAPVLEAAGDSVSAALLFGSRLVGTSPDEHSAFDLFLIVSDYRRFYEGLRGAGHIRRPAGLFAALNRVMPPNVVSFVAPPHTAKLFVMEDDDFARSMSARSRDHFCRGRLSQRVVVLHARDEGTHARMTERLAANVRDTLAWAGPYLPPSFDAEGYARCMLDVSYGAEVRPEAAGRSGEVYEAQADFFQDMYGALLADLADAGTLEALPPAQTAPLYRFSERAAQRYAGAGARRRVRRYFALSKTRAVLRWGKYILTYENWLDYLVRKVERRSDLRIDLTPWERRLPLLLLWPKVFRVLRALRDTREDA